MARLLSLRALTAVGCGLCALTALVACVDLFHSTDFGTTDCTADPSSCAAETGSTTEAGTGPTKPADSSTKFDFCSWRSSEALTQAGKACALLGACLSPMGSSTFGTCWEHAAAAFDCEGNPGLRPAGEADDFWHCVAEADSCDAGALCVFPSGVPKCTVSGGGTFTGCSGAARVECSASGQPPTAVEACMAAGQTCHKIDQSTAVCAGSKGVDCAVGTSCSGTQAIDCSNAGFPTQDLGLDCANVGKGTCVTVDGGPICLPIDSASTECTADQPFQCVGDVLRGCYKGSRIEVNCGTFDRKCDSSLATGYDPFRACRERTATCPAADSCDGTVLESCGSGGRVRFDCKTAGMSGCQILANGNAACTR